MKKILSIIFLLTAAVAAWSVSPYPVLAERAGRFFAQKEWAQAAAVYGLMLDEHPEVADTYGRAVVANAIMGDTLLPAALMQKALENHVAFDSVFSRVREYSFKVGRADLYEGFLLQMGTSFPWMRRTTDSYLLRYYTFRQDGAKMDAYSRAMLDGAADHVGFLLLRAKALLLQGDYAASMETYKEVLNVSPDNYEALLTLGNWYFLQSTTTPSPTDSSLSPDSLSSDCANVPDSAADCSPSVPYLHTLCDALTARQFARAYLFRAYSLHPTPYVARQLQQLQ